MMCWRTVPQTDNSERMKLTEEGGKPQTVIQVSRGLGSGEGATSWAWQEILWSPGGDRRLAPRLPDPGVEIDLLGVKRRELVGGPPVLSLLLRDNEEFMFSFRSCGPRML